MTEKINRIGKSNSGEKWSGPNAQGFFFGMIVMYTSPYLAFLIAKFVLFDSDRMVPERGFLYHLFFIILIICAMLGIKARSKLLTVIAVLGTMALCIMGVVGIVV